MNDGTLNINVIIADRPYRLRIKPEEEEDVRKAARLIKEKIRELGKQYDAKDKQDFLAMTALTFAVETIQLGENTLKKDEGFTNKMTELDDILSEFLSK